MAVVRDLITIDDFRLAEEVQQRIWGMADRTEIVPLNMMLTAATKGGVALGAFENDEMVGLLFGFTGLDAENRPQHCSHMLGLVPGTRDRGLGASLKRAQRDRVLSQGIDLITWTFDPLESINAHLNFAKLGVTSNRYYRDHYGVMDDELNAGLPSDRLEVEWQINLPGVEERLAGSLRSPELREVEASGAHVIDPLSDHHVTEGRQLLIAIPADIQNVRRSDSGLAMAWRLGIRRVLESLFEQGYRLTDHLSDTTEGQRRSAYLASRSDHV